MRGFETTTVEMLAQGSVEFKTMNSAIDDCLWKKRQGAKKKTYPMTMRDESVVDKSRDYICYSVGILSVSPRVLLESKKESLRGQEHDKEAF